MKNLFPYDGMLYTVSWKKNFYEEKVFIIFTFNCYMFYDFFKKFWEQFTGAYIKFYIILIIKQVVRISDKIVQNRQIFFDHASQFFG